MPDPTPVAAPAGSTPAPKSPEVPAKAPAAPVAEPPKPQAEDPVEAVKRAQRELFQQREAWKQERAKADEEFASRQKAHEERLKKAEEAERRLRNLKRDPMGTLKETGVPWEELQEQALQDGKPTAGMLARDLEDRMEQRIAAIEAAAQERIKSLEAQLQTSAAEREQAAKAAWVKSTTEWVTQQGEKYELVNLYGLQANVAAEVERSWETEGQQLSKEEAAERLEKYLRSEVEKLKATKFWAAINAPAAKPDEADESNSRVGFKTREGPGVRRESAKPPARPPEPTLSNDLTPSTAELPDGLPADERWRRLKASSGF